MRLGSDHDYATATQSFLAARRCRWYGELSWCASRGTQSFELRRPGSRHAQVRRGRVAGRVASSCCMPALLGQLATGGRQCTVWGSAQPVRRSGCRESWAQYRASLGLGGSFPRCRESELWRWFGHGKAACLGYVECRRREEGFGDAEAGQHEDQAEEKRRLQAPCPRSACCRSLLVSAARVGVFGKWMVVLAHQCRCSQRCRGAVAGLRPGQESEGCLGALTVEDGQLATRSGSLRKSQSMGHGRFH
ncbi:hypothetical protein HDK64DRAFT_269990 [Phyllosticta capitalensis]